MRKELVIIEVGTLWGGIYNSFIGAINFWVCAKTAIHISVISMMKNFLLTLKLSYFLNHFLTQVDFEFLLLWTNLKILYNPLLYNAHYEKKF